MKKVIDDILNALPEVAGIYLFGSTGTPFEKKESDLDLAVLTLITLSPMTLWELSQRIARTLKKEVDLINLRDTSTVFAFQIITTGKRIYCHNQLVCDEFEMITYSNYLRLNEERKEILDAIKNRGRIFDE